MGSYSKKEAIRLAAKRAYEYIQTRQEASDSVKKVIGNFDLENAINKLEMLKDKKLISGLQYLYREEKPSKETNGNPMWFCLLSNPDGRFRRLRVRLRFGLVRRR